MSSENGPYEEPLTEHHPGGPGRLYRMTRVNALLATDAGMDAFRRGLKPRDCPYAPTDATQEFLAHFWLSGWWLSARPGIAGARAMHFERTMRKFGVDPSR